MNGGDIKDWRERLGFSQVQAARYIGIGRTTLQGWEGDPGRELPKWAAMAFEMAVKLHKGPKNKG